MEYNHAGAKQFVQSSDARGLIDLFDKVSGLSPAGVAVPAPFPDAPSTSKSYDWGSVSVTVSDGGLAIGMRVIAPALKGVPIRTKEGISVGSTRATLLATNPLEVFDSDGDGTFDDLGLGQREVPGTESLSHPGSVGIEFILVTMQGDTVKQIQTPRDDFSDL